MDGTKLLEEKSIRYGDPIHIVFEQSLIGEGIDSGIETGTNQPYETRYTEIDRKKLASIFKTKIKKGMAVVVRW
jgi:rubrerythrin